MSINEVKSMFAGASCDILPVLLEKFAHDERAGVKKLVESYNLRYNRYILENERLNRLISFDMGFDRVYGTICGVDEAGAGPLAGPVCAAAVVMPLGYSVINGVDDSKKLTADNREELREKILSVAIRWNVVFVDNKEIDEINILQARLKAMRLAVDGLEPRVCFSLVDGNVSIGEGIPCALVEKGDSRSYHIACASILAKVVRDEVMAGYHELYPQYGFDKHKGYGTKAHFAAIAEHGISP
ncbi:MAG: ribonuclease HII, partial [Defluviitaleaceae bacterium]|nr:ribonuclease HII [Defluviitaleaceae bacterium]